VGVATGMCRTETSSDSDEEQSAPLPKRDPPSFHVVNTRGLDHTATHLLCLHRLVQQRFFSSFSSPFLQNQRTLSEFQANSSRKQRLETMSDLLVTQLRQLPGCSTSAAEAISKRFGGTMSNLHFSLSSLDSVAAVVCPSSASVFSLRSLFRTLWRR
jgi:ERCC4-type nuclease